MINMNTHGATRHAIQIDVVSDVVCPWCFVGKRNLEAALRALPDVAATVHWRPYQLDSTIPPEGYDRRTYLERKFGDRVTDIYRRIEGVGQEVGISFAFEQIRRSPNTLDAHRLIRWAWAAGVQDEVVESLFRAFFIDGADIGDREILTQIATASGMDTSVVARLLSEDADKGEVTAEIDQARSLGVTGVPFFILDQNIGVSGAQPPDILVSAIRRALQSEPARENAA